jgi:hypothetical protein
MGGFAPGHGDDNVKSIHAMLLVLGESGNDAVDLFHDLILVFRFLRFPGAFRIS